MSPKGDPVNKTLPLLMFALALAAACGRQESVTAARAAMLPSQRASAAPAAAPAPAAQPKIVTGKIEETMSSGGYSYLKIRSNNGEDVWAAVPKTAAEKGSEITIAVQMVSENFESKTLNRKFDRLLFATVVPSGSQPQAAAPAVDAAKHMVASAAAEPISVPRAEGGKTVAEVWEGKSGLRDKPVVVRGKVVKFLPEIMGKNWLHLRDGSGSRAQGDDDITVTTAEKASVGDIVTISGTVRVDKDFGAGYRYPVIIENAKLQK